MFDYDKLLQEGLQYFWPMARMSGLLVTLPILDSTFIPSRIRIILAFFLSVIVVSTIPKVDIHDFDLGTLVIVGKEVLLGMMIGFVFQLLFQSFVIGGQIIAMQSGLGFATLVDPMSNANVPLVSQLYTLLVSLVFLAMDGHLAVLQFIVSSFQIIPLHHVTFTALQFQTLLNFSTWIFSGAVSIAIPAIVALLVVNLGFGIMARAAPQLNIFSIGFSITLTLGVIVLYLTLNQVLSHVEVAMNRGFELIHELVGQA